jgi:hypothetical protein
MEIQLYMVVLFLQHFIYLNFRRLMKHFYCDNFVCSSFRNL